MVLILGGNSEIGAHARSNVYYLICIRHLSDSLKSPIFLYACNACSELPSNTGTMDIYEYI